MTQQTLDPTVEEAIAGAAHGIRRRVLDHTIANNGGYLTQACCAAETFATLYLHAMRLGPSVAPPEPGDFPGVPGHGAPIAGGAPYNGAEAPDHDRFLLSPAHYALPLYAALIEAGRLEERALDRFNEDGSSVEMIGAEHSPGMEATTGSLGQALSVGIGLADGRRRRGESGRVWVYMSDGELQEGQTWEALQMGAALGIENLIVYLDANGFQCDGPLVDVMPIEPIADKLAAFGWTVADVDGHDIGALAAAPALQEPGKPLFVLCRTLPWQGIPSLQARAPRTHYVRFRPGEAEQALADLEAAR